MSEKEYKDCPYCGEEVKLEAIKCKHCKTMLSEEDNAPVDAAAAARPQQAAPKVKKPIWKRWWLWVIVGLLVITMISGGNGNDEEVAEEVEGEPNTEMVLPSYDVIEIEDLTFSNVKRYNWNVVVHDEITEEELILLSEQIVQEAKEVSDFNALSIMFYDYEEYIGLGYTLGSVDFAPGGDWAKADTVSTGAYDKMSFKYNFRLKDWSQRLTQDEVNIWKEWIDLVHDEAFDEDTAKEIVAESFSLTEDEVQAIINKQMIWQFQEADPGEDTSVDEAKVYDGAFKFAGEAILGVEGSEITIDTSVSADDDGNTYTDITVTEGMTDFEGNVFTPGIYEFQFVVFPEQTGQGSWYVYINDDIKISGNPNASDAGKVYELKEGDIISVEFWTIATFYKVAE